jgi:hypothetical protein
MAQIHEAICAAMAKTGAIGKDKKNIQQGFKYRGVDDVMNALQPVFSEFLIFCTPKVLDVNREERTTKNGGAMTYTVVTVEYTFYAADGSSVSCVVCGEGMDSADKSTSKAMSIAFKYACFQLLCIPTEETAPDPDKEYHEKAPKAPEFVCTKCGAEIKAIKNKDGKIVEAKDVYETLGGLCKECWKEANPVKKTEE